MRFELCGSSLVGCGLRLLSVGVLLAMASVSSAQQTQLFGYHLTLDTTALTTASGGPFALDFQFTDGSGDGNGNNTVIFQNFHFDGGGSLAGNPTLMGGTSGDLASTLTLTDNAFFTDYTEGFTPGGTLQTDIFLTSNPDTPTPDQLSFAVLDGNGNEVPTTLDSGALFTADLTGTGPVITTGTATGDYAGLGTPVLTPISSVPEPGLILSMFVIGGLSTASWWSRLTARERFTTPSSPGRRRI